MNVAAIAAMLSIFYIAKLAAYCYLAHWLNKVSKEKRSIYLVGFSRLILGIGFGFLLVFCFGQGGRGAVFPDTTYLALFFLLQAFLWALIILVFYRSLFASYQWLKWVAIGTVLSMILNIPLSLIGISNMNPG